VSKLTTASVPAFEVASVKVNTSGAPPSGDAKGDRLTLYNMPLKVIVARAYQVTLIKLGVGQIPDVLSATLPLLSADGNFRVRRNSGVNNWREQSRRPLECGKKERITVATAARPDAAASTISPPAPPVSYDDVTPGRSMHPTDEEFSLRGP
jgi:hypothetical protein